ncbi:MAG: elongation factor G [Ignavibacteriaceae bacterium]|nr:elongation factor G [Ignavibacteriaceae bacterium]MCW8823913.1 elongation factor G [Ignavibacteriaceae bacterium]MCW9094225.1 elongation factor G [Ignavibacteriaceae bacterium]MCW9095858.1 elongation factor G [Ignavibacteriaceae bacterium]
MKEIISEAIRNIALVGHGGSGKTTLSEVLLYTAKETNRIGKIEEGNTVSDYTPNEIDKQISISSSLMNLEWNNTKINIIDTPGFSDFIGDVQSALKVSDTAVMVIKSAEGIEVGTDAAKSIIDEYKLPSSVVINKVDSEHSTFFETYDNIKERIHPGATIITFPVSEGINFTGVVDIITMKSYTYGEVGSRSIAEAEIPGDLKEQAENLRTQLIEKVAEHSEDLMNKYFEEGSLSDDDLKKGLKASIINGSLIPVFALSTSKVVGINNFLDFVSNFFPSPFERGGVSAKLAGKKEPVLVKVDPSGEPVLFVFKTISEQHVGELSLFKLYSGKVTPGLDLLNESNEKTERLNQLFTLNGHNRKEISEVIAGDIAAVVKLKDTHTNNTLASKNYSIIIDPIKFPEPVIRGAIKAKAKGDEDKIATGLHTLHEEDPSFNVSFDPEISQTIISGQGELQLLLAVKRLKDRYSVDVDLVEPRIPFRETIKATANDVEYKHKKQSGGRGQYGHIHIKMEPLPRGKEFEFVNAIVGGVVPGRFIPAVEKGIIEIMSKGVLAGNKVVDVKVTLFDGTYHTVDSDEMSFKIAAMQGFKKGFLEAKPVLLEPIYEVEVKVPEEYMGDVMGDISSKRGRILGMDSDGRFQIIKALVPLAELYKYSSHLRSLTQGRGVHTRKFDHYEEMPKEIEQKVIEEYKKSREEEN